MDEIIPSDYVFHAYLELEQIDAELALEQKIGSVRSIKRVEKQKAELERRLANYEEKKGKVTV